MGQTRDEHEEERASKEREKRKEGGERLTNLQREREREREGGGGDLTDRLAHANDDRSTLRPTVVSQHLTQALHALQ